MKRREFIGLVGSAAAVWPMGVRAKQPVRIGLLNSGADNFFVAPFVEKLGELGYLEGKNIIIERKFAEGNLERLKEYAADLVRQHVDIIVTIGTPAGFAAKQATSTVPIVFGAMSDPVGVGLVASLARPGGNATGNSLMSPELSAKRLEILRALAPKLSHFAILWDSSNPGMAQRVRETEIAADQSHLLLHTVGPRNPEELEAAFAELLDKRPDALLDSSYVEAGGLMSYGPDYEEVFRTAAVLVSKILKGAKPADLPIEQPTKFQLFINLKTARALGIEIPPNLLVMAERIIE